MRKVAPAEEDRKGLEKAVESWEVKTSSFVGNFWDSALEFASAHPLVNPKVAARLWQLCDTSCAMSAKTKARTQTLLVEPVAETQPLEKKARTASVSNIFAVAIARDSAMAPPSSSVDVPEVASRVDRLKSQLWDTLLSFGNSSTHYVDLDLGSKSRRAEAKAIWIRGLDGTAAGTMAGAISAFSRWNRWALSVPADPLLPRPVDMASFLRDISAGGPTAALSAFRSLRWFCSKLGVELMLENPLVSPWGQPAVGHKSKGVDPAEIRVVIHWETLLSSPNPYVRQIACGNLLIIFGVLRFAHVQRSYMLKNARHVLVGKCSQGKSKVEGSRPGFFWALPKAGVAEKGMGDLIMEFLDSLANKAPNLNSFLLHDFLPKNADVTEALSFSSNPLQYARFQSATSRLLQCPPLGMGMQEAVQHTTYRGRRFLPTVGGLLHLGPEERASLGNWKDLSSSDREAGKASSNMGTRYDASRLSLSARSKSMCIIALGIACAKVKSFANPLQSMSQHFPAREELLDRTKLVTEDIPLNPDRWSTDKDALTDAVAFPLLPSDFEAARACSPCLPEELVSSSESEDSSSGPDLADLESLYAEHSNSVWVSPVTSSNRNPPKLHTVLGEDEGKYKVACGRKLPFSAERFVGWTAALGSPFEWCPRCWKLLPENLKITVPQ